MTVSIFRIEDKDHYGPYYSYRIPEELHQRLEMRSRENDTPNWLFDGIRDQIAYGEVSNYLSGFKSIQQMREWFGDDLLNELYQYGFVIKEYEVHISDVIFGASGKQLAFRKDAIVNISLTA